MGKHRGSEGRKSIKICDQKLPNVTSAATAAPALATPVQKTALEWENTKRMILATELSKLRNGRLRHAQTAGPWRTEKHQNCDQKLPNVTSETHRKG